MAKAVFCIARSEAQAAEVVSLLKLAGFSNDDISALLPDRAGSKDFAHEQHTKAPEGAVAGGGLGGILGATLGWLAGAGILPGMTPLFSAGPLLAALSVAAVGLICGAGVGAFIGAGIPEFEARRFAGKVHQGNILISVHCETDERARKVRKIFERSGAQNVAVRKEARVNGRPDFKPRPVH